MAWIQKRDDSGFWWIGTRVNGRQIRKSTGETDEAKARDMLADLEEMEARARRQKLNREFFEGMTGAHIEEAILFASLDQWLKATTNPHTHRNYETFADAFKKAMPENPVLSDIRQGQVRKFLDDIRAHKRPSTANLYLAAAKAFFSRFSSSLRKNPTEGIPRFKRDGTEVEKEAFSVDQIRSIMAIAEPFWQCASGIAFYTGLRLSNVAALKVKHIKAGRLELATTKTGAKVRVKLPDSVLKQIREAIPANAKPDSYIWPDKAALVESDDVTRLSEQFGRLLVKAGIREAQAGAGHGLKGRRNVEPLGFHSLRHAFITALASRGVNQQTVKQLVGHSSTRVNDAYTHIGSDTLDAAVQLLPDVTKGPK